MSDGLCWGSQNSSIWDFPVVPQAWPLALTSTHNALLPSLSLPPLVSSCQSGRRENRFLLLALAEVIEVINEFPCLSRKTSLIALLWLGWQRSAFYELKREGLFGAQFCLFMMDSSCIFYVCCCYIVVISINSWLVYWLWIYNDFTS